LRLNLGFDDIEHGLRFKSEHVLFLMSLNAGLILICSMTWGGQQGFQKPIAVDSFLVDGVGAMGTSHLERKLAYVEVVLSGHMVPQFSPVVRILSSPLETGLTCQILSLGCLPNDAIFIRHESRTITRRNDIIYTCSFLHNLTYEPENHAETSAKVKFPEKR